MEREDTELELSVKVDRNPVLGNPESSVTQSLTGPPSRKIKPHLDVDLRTSALHKRRTIDLESHLFRT